MLIICWNLLKLFEIKLILVVIYFRGEFLVVCGDVEGSHGPVSLSGPSTSMPAPAPCQPPHTGSLAPVLPTTPHAAAVAADIPHHYIVSPTLQRSFTAKLIPNNM